MYFPAYEVCDLNPAWSGHIISFCDIISLIELCTRLRHTSTKAPTGLYQNTRYSAFLETHKRDT